MTESSDSGKIAFGSAMIPMNRKELSIVFCFIFLLSCYAFDIRIGMGQGDGVRLSYRIVGKGKPLVVIHDGPGGEKSILYDGFDQLRSDMRVIYYDQRGCGKSQPITPATSCTIDDNVRDLESLRRYLHLRRFSIAAHGWGVVIAIEYARRHPDRVESMVLITPIAAHPGGRRLEEVVNRLPDESRHTLMTALNDPRLSLLQKRELILRHVMPLLFYNEKARRSVDLSRLRYSPEVGARLGEELKSLDLRTVLGEVKVPTLIAVSYTHLTLPTKA